MSKLINFLILVLGLALGGVTVEASSICAPSIQIEQYMACEA